MKNKWGIVAIVAAMILVGTLVVAGLWSPLAADSSGTPGEKSTDENGGKPLQEAEVDVFPNGFNRTNDLQNAPTHVFIDVRIRGYQGWEATDSQLCLYDSEGDVLAHPTVGTIVSHRDGEFVRTFRVNLSVDQRPSYIVVDHPKLRNKSYLRNQLLYWDASSKTYQHTYDTLDEIQDRFEWPRSNETGECG